MPTLLEQITQQPAAELWKDLWGRLTVEGECHTPAGFAALPALSAIAQGNSDDNQSQALLLAATIVQTLHRHHHDDDLVRAVPQALATLYRIAEARLANCSAEQFVSYFRAALAFAGYTFWAQISLDYADEHYRIDCPHCAIQLWIVIGDYGHYCAIRDEWAGDVQRVALRPAEPGSLKGVRRWMHDTAAVSQQVVLANGLTYLFGDATCGGCGCMFNVADWYEAENSPVQPIEPVVPRADRSA